MFIAVAHTCNVLYKMRNRPHSEHEGARNTALCMYRVDGLTCAVRRICMSNLPTLRHRDERVSRRGSRPLRVGPLCLPTLPLARLGSLLTLPSPSPPLLAPPPYLPLAKCLDAGDQPAIQFIYENSPTRIGSKSTWCANTSFEFVQKDKEFIFRFHREPR